VPQYSIGYFACLRSPIKAGEFILGYPEEMKTRARREACHRAALGADPLAPLAIVGLLSSGEPGGC